MRILSALAFALASAVPSAQTPAPAKLPAPPDVAAPPADATKTVSGLATKVITPGTGKDHPAKDDVVTVHYTGWKTDGTMFIELEGVDVLHDRLQSSAKIVMPLETKFYGMREFAIEDPDGYVVTFAERV